MKCILKSYYIKFEHLFELIEIRLLELGDMHIHLQRQGLIYQYFQMYFEREQYCVAAHC